MLKRVNASISTLIFGGAIALASTVQADLITDAVTSGKVSGDIRMRYEDVSSGSADGDGLTIRTRLGYTTGNVEGFSATVEFEDVRDMLGIDDEKGLTTESENSELEQGFLQYKNSTVTAKLGRQVIALDGHRHVGHVGWKQDRQTFDAARVVLTPIKELTVDLAYLWRRNRINSPAFADVTDTSDKLINVTYQTPIGKLVGYGYSLSAENSGPAWDETATYGVSLSGRTSGDTKFLYNLEYAQQDNKTAKVDTNYTWVELGVSVAGVTGKLGYEVLGSDTNGGTPQNFQTPIATVHKFNGWADAFLGGSLFGTINGGNGLKDTYLSVGAKVAGIKLLAVYHDYDADRGSADLGDEINLLAAKKFGKNYSAGLKYADYSAGDTGTGTDTDKLWFWLGMTF